MSATSQPVPSTSCVRCHGDIPAPAAFCPHCGASQHDPAPPGPILPGYTIVRQLGSGGAADVYLARQDDLDRDVAIKVLRRDVDDPKQWRRFQREAHTIARLSSHPHVVTVHTAGRADTGQPYLVTEFLDRGSLGDVVAAEGPLSPVRAASVGVAVADALTAAHGLGILHRDVKPGNVLLAYDGRVKLGDFGIARLLEAQAVTITDVIAFTPEHVAPELLRNEPDGPWSDVYGLASTVASALLGRPLFRMGPEERIDAFLARKVTSPPPALPAWVPPVLGGPTVAALDPDPRRRPSLPDLRRALEAAAAELSGATPAPPAVTPTALVPPTERLSTPDGTNAPGGHRPLLPAGGYPRGPVAVDVGRRTRPRRGLGAVIAVAVLALLALMAVAAGLFDGEDPEGAIATTATVPATTIAPTTVAPAAAVPTTAAPTTAVPTTVPTTRPAETPRVAPPVPVPPPASTNPPATSPPRTTAAALLTSSEAETYLRSYYDAVAAGDYDRTWAQLAPEFQNGTARSFSYYVGFWQENTLEVGDVELVRADADQAVVNAELRWNGSTEAVVSQFTLRPGRDGAVLIADQQTISD